MSDPTPEPPKSGGMPEWLRRQVAATLGPKALANPTLEPLPTDDLEPGQIGLLADEGKPRKIRP